MLSRAQAIIAATAASGLAAVVAIWTAVASVIFLIGSGLWRQEPAAFPPPQALWQYWVYLPYRQTNPQVALWIHRAGAFATLALLLAAAAAVNRVRTGRKVQQLGWLRPRPVERGSSDNHGHADWMSMAELRQLFPGPDGVVLGEAYRVDQDSVASMRFNPLDRRTWGNGGKTPLLIDPCTGGPGHSLIFAGSGGFKTTCAVSTMLTWTGSAVVLDPSCEMGPILCKAREQMGHRVIGLAPASAATVGVNVLDWIDIDDPLAEGHVQSVVVWACGEPKRAVADEAQFFASRGKKLVTCILADMLWDEKLPPGKKTLRDMRAVVATPEKQMKTLLKTIHRTSKSPMARSVAGSLCEMSADETWSGIYANANEMTFWLSVPAYADLVSGSAFRTADIARGAMTVFLQIPLETLISSSEVARVLVGALMNAVYRRDGEQSGRVLFLLDEAARLGRMDVLAKARDTGRKHGVTVQMLMQSVGQLEAVWGREEKRSWYDGVSWRAYAAVHDWDTARELSDLFGSHAAVAYSEGDNTGRQRTIAKLEGGSRSSGQNTSRHEIKRALINPSELLQDTPTDELFVYAGGKPIRCGRAIYFRRPELKDRVAANRFATQG
jgi:type IV secretion system protein VirD4